MNKKVKYGFLGLLVVIGGLVAAPVISAEAYKSRAADAVNPVVDKLNEATKELSLFIKNKTPTKEQTKTLVEKEKAAKQAVDEANDKVSSVGGFAGIDIFGQYRDAKMTSQELNATLSELSGLYSADIARTESLSEIFNVLNESADASDPKQLEDLSEKLSQATGKYSAFAATKGGEDIDKRTAKALEQMAQVFKQLAVAAANQDISALEKVISDLDSAEANLDKLQTESDEFNQQLLDKFNASVNKLNDQTGKL